MHLWGYGNDRHHQCACECHKNCQHKECNCEERTVLFKKKDAQCPFIGLGRITKENKCNNNKPDRISAESLDTIHWVNFRGIEEARQNLTTFLQVRGLELKFCEAIHCSDMLAQSSKLVVASGWTLHRQEQAKFWSWSWCQLMVLVVGVGHRFVKLARLVIFCRLVIFRRRT